MKIGDSTAHLEFTFINAHILFGTRDTSFMDVSIALQS